MAIQALLAAAPEILGALGGGGAAAGGAAAGGSSLASTLGTVSSVVGAAGATGGREAGGSGGMLKSLSGGQFGGTNPAAMLKWATTGQPIQADDG